MKRWNRKSWNKMKRSLDEYEAKVAKGEIPEAELPPLIKIKLARRCPIYHWLGIRYTPIEEPSHV